MTQTTKLDEIEARIAKLRADYSAACAERRVEIARIRLATVTPKTRPNGLSTRACNVLANAFYELGAWRSRGAETMTPAEIIEAASRAGIAEDQIVAHLIERPNCGNTTLAEIERWLAGGAVSAGQ